MSSPRSHSSKSVTELGTEHQFIDPWHDAFGAGYYFPAFETHAEQILT